MAKILLVEDDNNLREIYEARLQAEGYTIVSAMDGEEALVVAKKENPDLIISDVMMPRISGFEMLDILRNTDGLKSVKVIMLTALGQAEDKTRADSLGADRYLVKSQVTLEDIVKAAQELLGPASSDQQAATQPAAPQPQAAAVQPQSVIPVTAPPQPVAVAAAPTPPAPQAAPVVTTPPVAPAAPPQPVATPPSIAPQSPSARPAPVVVTPRPFATPTAPVVPTQPASTPPVAPSAPVGGAPQVQQPAVTAEPAVPTSEPTQVAPAAEPVPTILASSPTPAVAPAPQPMPTPTEPISAPEPPATSSAPDPTPSPQATAPTPQPAAPVTANATAEEEQFIKDQIESFVRQGQTPTPPVAPAPQAAPAQQDTASNVVMTKALENLMSAAGDTTPAPQPAPEPQPPQPMPASKDGLAQMPAPAVVAPQPQPEPAPEPTPAAPPEPTVDEGEEDGVTVAHKKIISPISSGVETRPGLDELMAREGVNFDDKPHVSDTVDNTLNAAGMQVSQHPPGHVIAPNPGSSAGSSDIDKPVDPNSIAL